MSAADTGARQLARLRELGLRPGAAAGAARRRHDRRRPRRRRAGAGHPLRRRARGARPGGGRMNAGAVFDAVLTEPRDAHLLSEHDGRRIPLHPARWLGPPCPVDEAIAAAAVGPVLDIGCGPGRLLDSLALHGTEAMGIDLSPAAVALARGRGRNVRLGSVFDAVPGGWATALLLDGSVGIGGDPARSCSSASGALADVAIVEVGAPGTGTRRRPGADRGRRPRQRLVRLGARRRRRHRRAGRRAASCARSGTGGSHGSGDALRPDVLEVAAAQPPADVDPRPDPAGRP